ncbi:MAG: phage tail tip lysozyme [Alphaproteobacteria bacterium]
MAKFDMPKTGGWEVRGGWLVRRLAEDFKLTLEQAAGFVGNLGYESVGLTELQERKPLIAGSRGGYGWAMHTRSRRLALEDYARKRGLAVGSDEAQYGFISHELRGSHANVLARLKDCASLKEACNLVHVMYERSYDVITGTYASAPDRLHYAERALAGARDLEKGKSFAPPVAVEKALVAFEEAAKRLQIELQKEGLYRGQIDGLFGPVSWAAFRAYRKAYPGK